MLIATDPNARTKASASRGVLCMKGSGVLRSAFVLTVILLLQAGASTSSFAEEKAADIGPRAEEKATPQHPLEEAKEFLKGKEGIGSSLKIFMLLTLMSFLPAILVMMTSFTRIVIVLGFIRQALATQQVPPNLVLIGLSFFLTLFIMSPIWKKAYNDAYVPYIHGEINEEAAVDLGLKPLRTFMGKQTRQKDLALFIELSGAAKPDTFDDVPTTTLIPAFVISELRTAFQMGFLIFLPFIVIDMVVASILMSLGMVMLPPAMIALPIKLLLFVLADGWRLIAQTVVASFGMG